MFIVISAIFNRLVSVHTTARVRLKNETYTVYSQNIMYIYELYNYTRLG